MMESGQLKLTWKATANMEEESVKKDLWPVKMCSANVKKLTVFNLQHSLANWDSCPTPAKSEGIEYLKSWPHRN